MMKKMLKSNKRDKRRKRKRKAKPVKEARKKDARKKKKISTQEWQDALDMKAHNCDVDCVTKKHDRLRISAVYWRAAAVTQIVLVAAVVKVVELVEYI